MESITTKKFTLNSNLELSQASLHLPCSHVQHQNLKKELNHLIELGILELCGASEWVSPAFIIPETNQLNITTHNITPDHFICWLSYVEEYNPYIPFIPGKENEIADTLS